MEHLATKLPTTDKPPPTVICYICSRQFGSKSIAIHEPQCLQKWHHENNKLPKEQRRKGPIKPDIVLTGDRKIDHNAMNDALWEASQANLVPCENCNRTFNPDRLAVHQRSCTKDNPHSKVPKK